MKPRFVPIYLVTVAVILATTAVAKVPAIFHERTWCIDDPILGVYQPAVSNEQLLGFAACTELGIVLLICISRWNWRWLPCLAAALWGTACVIARWFLMDPYANCRCLGWLAKPGLNANITAGALALGIALGGWLAFKRAWHEARKTGRDSPLM
jgi:hypothetical protein